MHYLLPRTFHRPCHDLPGLMIRLVYQGAPERAKKIFLEIQWTIQRNYFCMTYDRFSNLEYKSLITSLDLLVAGVC